MTAAHPTSSDHSSQTTRAELLAGTMSIALINGWAAKAIEEIGRVGLPSSLSTFFGVSLIVWIAGLVSLQLMWRDPRQDFQRKAGREANLADWIIAAACTLAAFMPL